MECSWEDDCGRKTWTWWRAELDMASFSLEVRDRDFVDRRPMSTVCRCVAEKRPSGSSQTTVSSLPWWVLGKTARAVRRKRRLVLPEAE